MRSEERKGKNKAQEGGDAALPAVRRNYGQVRWLQWEDMAMPQQAVQMAYEGELGGEMSVNTITIPLNPEGALELGQCPCDACGMGSATWNTKGKAYDCRDKCDYYKRYQKNLSIEIHIEHFSEAWKELAKK